MQERFNINGPEQLVVAGWYAEQLQVCHGMKLKEKQEEIMAIHMEAHSLQVAAETPEVESRKTALLSRLQELRNVMIEVGHVTGECRQRLERAGLAHLCAATPYGLTSEEMAELLAEMHGLFLRDFRAACMAPLANSLPTLPSALYDNVARGLAVHDLSALASLCRSTLTYAPLSN